MAWNRPCLEFIDGLTSYDKLTDVQLRQNLEKKAETSSTVIMPDLLDVIIKNDP